MVSTPKEEAIDQRIATLKPSEIPGTSFAVTAEKGFQHMYGTRD
jgi:hypothetical protein